MEQKTEVDYVGPHAHRADLEKRFTYHAPKGDQLARYAQIRESVLNVAAFIVDCCPPSRELSLALQALEEAVMWANASIARWE